MAISSWAWAALALALPACAQDLERLAAAMAAYENAHERNYQPLLGRPEARALAAMLAELNIRLPATTAAIDWAGELGKAGIRVELEKRAAPGIYSGLHTESVPGALLVVDAEPGSPARSSNVKPGDSIMTIDGRAATAAELHTALQERAPGQPVVLRLRRGETVMDVQLYTVPNFERRYRLTALRPQPR